MNGKVKTQHREIELGKLYWDRRNPNTCKQETMDKLAANLKKTGICPTLAVRPNPYEKGTYIIIDGFHRKLVLEQMGWETVPCQIFDVDEKMAGVLLSTMNRLRGEDSPYKRAQLLDELQKCFDVDDLLQWIPESKGELADLVSLLELGTIDAEKEISNILGNLEKHVPEILNFVMSKAAANFVKDVLATFQPEDSKDPSKGLIALCKSVQPQTEKTEE